MFVRMTCELESYIVAVERVKEYADCPQEVHMLLLLSLICFSYGELQCHSPGVQS